MLIVGKYSFNGGETFIKRKYSHLLDEVENTIAGIEAEKSRTLESRERFFRQKTLYNPMSLDKQFKNQFERLGWYQKREFSKEFTSYYTSEYQWINNDKRKFSPTYREIDFVKDHLGVEVQFGKYAFMLYDICVKMVIFKNLGYIDAGIEIVPIQLFAAKLSAGVSYFEQILWDLQKRGVSDIDIPVLVLGVSPESLLEGKDIDMQRTLW